MAIGHEAVSDESSTRRSRSLRVVNSDLYDWISERLEENRVHPYDVWLRVEEEADSVDGNIYLKAIYGDNFEHVFEKELALEELTAGSEQVAQFITEFLAACEEGLILDYRKFMQPHT